MGKALEQFFNIPYKSFKPERARPLDLLKNLRCEVAEWSGWIPLEDTGDAVVILTTDPERVTNSGGVNNVYPRSKLVYRVCTAREFSRTLDQMFGGGA